MSTPTPATPKLHRLGTLFAGEEINVLKLDGTEIKVKVAHVPIRHLEVFVDLYDKPAELVDFVTHVDGKPVPAGWCDCLTDIAAEQIRAKAKEINFQRAVVWMENQITAGKEMAQPIVAKLTALRSFVLTQASSQAEAAKKS
jgi:hypothetical protein